MWGLERILTQSFTLWKVHPKSNHSLFVECVKLRRMVLVKDAFGQLIGGTSTEDHSTPVRQCQKLCKQWASDFRLEFPYFTSK